MLEEYVNRTKLSGHITFKDFPQKLITAASELNHADISKVCEDAIKQTILHAEDISVELLLNLTTQRLRQY